MGRLFWKFFLVLLLAQTVSVLGVGLLIGLHNRDTAVLHTAGERAPAFNPNDPNFRLRRDGPPPEEWHKHEPPRHLIPALPLLSGLAASFVFAGVLAWYFAKPIRSLRNALDAVSRGDLAVRLGPVMGARRDELADLGRDFDSMAQRLQSLMDGQRRLFHDVSHELRSPLARMQVAIGLARQQPDRLEQTLMRVERESVRIDQLVSELLTLARLESGMASGHVEAVVLGELVRNIIEDSRVEADARGCQLALEDDPHAVVDANAELLRRGIENVLRNAIKHSPAGGTVQVVVGVIEDGCVQVSIRDAGGGVAEAALEHIFEPFFRDPESAVSDGHGLGLAIARRVVETHGGSISARNTHGGLEVVIELLRRISCESDAP